MLHLDFEFVSDFDIRISYLFLRFCDFFGLLRDFRCQINNLPAIIPATIHADGVAPVQNAAILAFRKPRIAQSVVRAPIIAVSPRCPHPIYHWQ